MKEQLNADSQKVKDFILQVLKERLKKEEMGLCLRYTSHHGDSSSTSYVIIKKDHKVLDLTNYDCENKISFLKLENLKLSELLDFLQDDDCSLNNEVLTGIKDDFTDFEPNIIPIIEKELLGQVKKKKKFYTGKL